MTQRRLSSPPFSGHRKLSAGLSTRVSGRLRGALALAVAALVLAPLVLPVASGRPGGGQNYRAPTRSSPSRSTPSYHPTPSYTPRAVPVPVPVPSGGSSGSGSSYSSTPRRDDGGGGFWIFLLIVIGIILLVWWLRKKKPERATIGVDQGAQDRGIAALRARDPAFDPAAFVERTRATVARVNDAWLGGNMGPARRVISDGVYVRFTTQLGLLAADGLRNVMVDWRVVQADILAAEGDDLWDTVHVKVVGEARDADVPAILSKEDAEKRARGQGLNQYQEVWSFIRRRGKHSKAGVPALSGQCPSCGADLPLSESVKCEYCQAVINSGEHDWVLAEITQPEEWSVRGQEAEVEGLAELRQRDPSVSRQELEDRASVIFWKWIEARGTGKLEKLARFLVNPPTSMDDPAAREGLLLTAAKLKQATVGSSDVLGVRVNAAEGRDQVLVEIRWSAGIDGREPEGMVHLLLLARSAQATSKRGLSSLDCPVCKGNLAGSDAVKCSYCGETLPGGKHEWALLRVQVGEAPEAEEDDGDQE